MHKEIHGWHSPSLNKHMDIAMYGHYGWALLLVPTAAADFLEYERFLLLDTLAPYINAGQLKVFSINSINSESWLNRNMHPRHKIIRHTQFNAYVYNEVIPFIKSMTSQNSSIITCGASFGALHSLNLFLKRPDLIQGTIAMSGVYDLTYYTDGYSDEDVYFNNPMHYMRNFDDPYWGPKIKESHHIHFVTGSGAYERPSASQEMSGLLWEKGIWNECDVWGPDMRHDWPTWRAMLPHYIATRFNNFS